MRNLIPRMPRQIFRLDFLYKQMTHKMFKVRFNLPAHSIQGGFGLERWNLWMESSWHNQNSPNSNSALTSFFWKDHCQEADNTWAMIPENPDHQGKASRSILNIPEIPTVSVWGTDNFLPSMRNSNCFSGTHRERLGLDFLNLILICDNITTSSHYLQLRLQ